MPVHLHGFAHFFFGDVGTLGYLQCVGAAFVLLLKLAEHAADPVDGTCLVERYAHDTALFGNGLQNALTNPPYGIADEFEAACLVELLGSPDESQVSLVDEVGEGKPLVLVLFGNRDNKAKIGLGQAVKSLSVTLADALCQLYFFINGK